MRTLPRILIIDDLLGRSLPDLPNYERENFCGQMSLKDITGDTPPGSNTLRVKHPVAEAVFHRGQTPVISAIGDVVANDLEGTLKVVGSGWDVRQDLQPCWSLVLLDLCFHTGNVTSQSDAICRNTPEGDDEDNRPENYFGLRVLRALHDHFPDLPVIILSSKPRSPISLEFAKLGALAFLPKSDPDSHDLFDEYLFKHGLIPDSTGTIIGTSKQLLFSLRAARRCAADRRNVLITGERGTGKELLARFIHERSMSEFQHPLVTVNSGGLSPSLYGSELFGHRRGAFTDARDDKTGAIQRANGGELFLDEIANMPREVQRGLLRVLEMREVQSIGAEQSEHVDVRYLSATNEDLERLSESGEFRHDLLDRLREGGTIRLPPLRYRLNDITALVTHFVEKAQKTLTGTMPRDVDKDVYRKLSAYLWPGNVRELRDCVFQAIAQNPDVEHLVPLHIHLPRASLSSASRWDSVDAVIKDSPDLTVDRPHIHTTSQGDTSTDTPDLLGALSRLDDTTGIMIAEFVRKAILATRRTSPSGRDSSVQITPALRLLYADPSMTSTKAADRLKQIIRTYPSAVALFNSDPLLRDALQSAEKIRPRSRTSASTENRTRVRGNG